MEAVYLHPNKGQSSGLILFPDSFVVLKNGDIIHISELRRALTPFKKLGYKTIPGSKYPAIVIHPLLGQNCKTVIRDIKSVLGWKAETPDQRLKRLARVGKSKL